MPRCLQIHLHLLLVAALAMPSCGCRRDRADGVDRGSAAVGSSSGGIQRVVARGSDRAASRPPTLESADNDEELLDTIVATRHLRVSDAAKHLILFSCREQRNIAQELEASSPRTGSLSESDIAAIIDRLSTTAARMSQDRPLDDDAIYEELYRTTPEDLRAPPEISRRLWKSTTHVFRSLNNSISDKHEVVELTAAASMFWTHCRR